MLTRILHEIFDDFNLKIIESLLNNLLERRIVRVTGCEFWISCDPHGDICTIWLRDLTDTLHMTYGSYLSDKVLAEMERKEEHKYD